MLESFRTALLKFLNEAPENAPNHCRFLTVYLEHQSSNIKLLLFEQVIVDLFSIWQLLQERLNEGQQLIDKS